MSLYFEQNLALSHFEQMEALEAACYSRELITPAREAYEWYVHHPHSVVVLLEGQRVASFINLLPVAPALFEKILSGTFNDASMTWKDILSADMLAAEPFELFLSCIVVAPEFRGHGLANLLLSKAAKPYLNAIRENRCQYVVTDNATPSGVSLSERLGFKFAENSDHHSKIYLINAPNFLEKALCVEKRPPLYFFIKP